MKNWKSSLEADILSKKPLLRRVNTITAVMLDNSAYNVYYIKQLYLCPFSPVPVNESILTPSRTTR